MAEPSWYDFLIPSEETREAILKGIEAGKRDVRILKEEGPEALELRRKEQEFIDLGHDDETASILAKQAIENDPRIRIIPKDFNFIGDAKASKIHTEETETEEVKDINEDSILATIPDGFVIYDIEKGKFLKKQGNKVIGLE